MKKFLITVLLLSIAWGAFSQPIDTSMIDLSEAQLSIAGPDRVYVRNIYYGDTRMSVILEYNGAAGATVIGPYFDDTKLLQDDYELGYAKMRIQGGDTLVISDMVIAGAGVSGQLTYDGVYTLDLSRWWTTTPPTPLEEQLEMAETARDRYMQELAATQGAFAAREAEALEQIAAGRLAYEVQISRLEQQVLGLEQDMNALNRAIVMGMRDYETTIASLRRQLSEAGVEEEEASEEDRAAGNAVQELAELQRQVEIGIRDYENQIAALERELADAEDEIDSMNEMIEDGVRDYDSRIAALQDRVDALSSGDMAMAGPAMTLPTRLGFSGFGGGESLLGTWTAGSRLSQTDAGSLFAKYAIPGMQGANRTLYTFDATTSADGRVGYGLHFYASDDVTGRGYGFGNSYLVWLTRDEAYYQNDNTYVQVYRSYNDVRMLQIASVAIDADITDTNEVQALYDRLTDTITVWVNGDEALSIPVAGDVNSGDKVAFRTLGGPVTFSNAAVRYE